MNYLQERRDDSSLLATDLLGSTPREFARQFRDVYDLRDRPLSSPVAHLMMRPAPGEDLTREEWQQALAITLAQMGYSNSPYVAYLHDHGDGRHLHIATLRIAYDGTTVSDSNDHYRMMSVARVLEDRFALERPVERQDGRLSKAELRRRLEDPERANRVEALRETIDRAAESSRTLRELCSRLEHLGVQPRLKVARNTGVVQGITFTISQGGDDETFKGSELGKKYSLAAIVNRHELLLNHRPNGPVLAITELTHREVQQLRADGLAPDFLASSASRWTGYWHLPQNATGFTDLLAARLPHRIQSFVDSPAARAEEPGIDPQILEQRELQAELAGLISDPRTSAALAPTIPLSLLNDLQGDMASDLPYLHEVAAGKLSRYDVGRVASLCKEVSARVAYAAELGRVSHGSLDLRATYQLLVSLALRQPEISRLTPGKDKQEDYPAALLQRFSAAQAAVSALTDSTSFAEAQRAHRAYAEVLDELELLRLAQGRRPSESFADRVDDPGLSRGKDQAAPSASQPGESLETGLTRGKDLSSIPPQDEACLTPGKFRNALEGGLAPLAESQEKLRAEADRLALDLLAAFDRYTADPSEIHSRDFRAVQRAYEKAARYLDRLPSREPLPRPVSSTAIEDLRTSLLHAQDRYFSAPSPETEREWRSARMLYIRAADSSRGSSPPTARLPLQETRRQFLQAHSNTSTAERLHLADPRPSTRQRWLTALKELDRTERLYGTALRREQHALAGKLRASAQSLSDAEDRYFRSPTPATQAQWISALHEHRRADNELAAIREEARGFRSRIPYGRDTSRRDLLRSETDRLLRYFERVLTEKVSPVRLLRQLEPQRLASRLATRAGRRVLSQVLPPVLRAGLQGVTVATDSARQMFKVYLELRAVRERLSQSPLLLEQGNLSSAAITDALRRSSIRVPVPSPAPAPRNAVAALRVEEATLRRTLRAFHRGAVSRESLLGQACRTLQARDAVTQACVRGLGAPTLQSFTAVVGSTNSKALSGWTSALARVGLTPRTIAVAALEAAPALATGLAVTIAAGRRLAVWCAQHIRKQILTMDRQNEGRQ